MGNFLEFLLLVIIILVLAYVIEQIMKRIGILK